jgi:hypothetical protein
LSLRAATVRSAQQTLGVVALLPLLLVIIVPMLPASFTGHVVSLIMDRAVSAIMIPVVSVMLALNLVLLLAALRRFQRARLILD